MIVIKSHGFKFSRPEANIAIDVSFFKNPWRDENIKNEKDIEKRKKMIMKFMNDQKGVVEFIESVAWMIRNIDKTFPGENVVVALCCSAGEYRSPAMVLLLNDALNRLGIENIISSSLNSKI